MDIGNQIRSLRNGKGLTQQQLANKLDLAGRTIQKWESGERSPNSTQRRKLCDLFQITEAELFGQIIVAEPQAQYGGIDPDLANLLKVNPDLQEFILRYQGALLKAQKGDKAAISALGSLLETIPKLDRNKLEAILKLAS